MKIVITGGHHSSALPVIEELKNTLKVCEFFWIGHKYSLLHDKNPTLEYIEISQLNIPFYDLAVGKVYGKAKLVALYKQLVSCIKAFILLKKIAPDVILSFGGYIAVPVACAGWLLRIPIVTHEQTMVSGYANRLIAFFASKILLSFESSLQFYKKSPKVIVTGLPLRKAIFEPGTNNLELNTNLPTIYVTGGKSGSHKLNVAVGLILPELLKIANVIHQVGDYSETRDFEEMTSIYNTLVTKNLPNNLPGKYIIRKFVLENEIGEVFSKSSLVVSRAGAHIVSELLTLGKSSILVPIPWVSHNEQNLNAQLLVSHGLGIIYPETQLSNSDLLLQTILKQLQTVSNNQKVINYDSPAKKIAQETIKISKQ